MTIRDVLSNLVDVLDGTIKDSPDCEGYRRALLAAYRALGLDAVCPECESIGVDPICETCGGTGVVRRGSVRS